jgi:eukaryotic-like serine/threonine-protein kinase
MSASTIDRETVISLIRESGLVSDRVLSDSLARCQSTDPNVLLVQMMTAGHITDYHVRELAAGRNKGFIIGKYKVLKPLATGGMGVVLHCEHVHMRHQVAIKLLPKEMNEDSSAVARFYREARAVAAVKHPNVVQAFDVGLEGNWHCMVMEYVDGVNFHKLITRCGALSELRVAHYIAQACAGLQCIMTSGLIHRDIKPGNLVLSKDNVVKVLDLGLARFLDQRADELTRQLDNPQVLGTADFISPEQALQSHNVDIRTDIYSLGMTAYFLITGKFPFKIPTLAGKLMSHQMKMPKPLRERRPEISEAFDAIFLKMIQKKPSERFQTPQDVIDALKPWLDVPLPSPEPDWFTAMTSITATSIPRPSNTSAPQAAPSTRAGSRARSSTTEIPLNEVPTKIAMQEQPRTASDAMAELDSIAQTHTNKLHERATGRIPAVRKPMDRKKIIILAMSVPAGMFLILLAWMVVKWLK